MYTNKNTILLIRMHVSILWIVIRIPLATSKIKSVSTVIAKCLYIITIMKNIGIQIHLYKYVY